MIKINLAKRKKSNLTGKAPATGGFGGLTLDTSAVRELPIKKFLVPVAASLVAMYMLDDYKVAQIQEQDTLLTQERASVSKLKAELVKYRGYEKLEKQLEEDEFKIKSKIDAIETLVAGQNSAVEFLKGLSESLPELVWLRKLQVDRESLNFSGTSLGFDPYSSFMEKLQETAFVKELVPTSTITKGDQKPSLVDFELLAKRNLGLKGMTE